jgi:hypothetical protein
MFNSVNIIDGDDDDIVCQKVRYDHKGVVWVGNVLAKTGWLGACLYGKLDSAIVR